MNKLAQITKTFEEGKALAEKTIQDNSAL